VDYAVVGRRIEVQTGIGGEMKIPIIGIHKFVINILTFVMEM